MYLDLPFEYFVLHNHGGVEQAESRGYYGAKATMKRVLEDGGSSKRLNQIMSQSVLLACVGRQNDVLSIGYEYEFFPNQGNSLHERQANSLYLLHRLTDFTLRNLLERAEREAKVDVPLKDIKDNVVESYVRIHHDNVGSSVSLVRVVDISGANEPSKAPELRLLEVNVVDTRFPKNEIEQEISFLAGTYYELEHKMRDILYALKLGKTEPATVQKPTHFGM